MYLCLPPLFSPCNRPPLLHHFRINDPYRLLSLFILLIALYLPLFIHGETLTPWALHHFLVGEKISDHLTMYTEVLDNTPILAAWVQGLLSAFFGRSLLASHLVGFFLLFLESAILGTLFMNRKAFLESTFVPSLIFSLIAFTSFEMTAVSGYLLGSLFILLALNNLLREIEFERQRDENVFGLGVLLSVASLLDLSYVIYLPGSLLLLVLYTRIGLRKHLLVLTGFLLPHLLLNVFYFLSGNQGILWKFYYTAAFNTGIAAHASAEGLLWLAAIPAFYFLISILFLNRAARVTKYQSQVIQIMFLWMIFAGAQILLHGEVRPGLFITIIPSLSFFISYFLLLIRRRRFAEMNTWVLLITLTGLSYLIVFGDVAPLRFQASIPGTPSRFSNKRLLVLADEPGLYVGNHAATGFVNWQLSQAVFRHPENYHNVITVFHSISKDPPEVIVDPEGLMKPFFQRLPTLARAYEIDGEMYRLKPSN